jgi:hypothetical protein
MGLAALRRAAIGFASILVSAVMAAAAPAEPPVRVEARSSDLLAVGLVHQDRMIVHISRLIDNAPVRDVTLTVVLRGAAHLATAETDGSFTLQNADLALPGTAAVEFRVEGAARETLRGTLQIAAAAGRSDDRNSSRQLWWWVLNFAVCIGFLWLYARRRKTTAQS